MLERPQAVAAVHRAYVAAGAQVVHTCTFGALSSRLSAVGLEGRGGEVVRRAVRLARHAGPRFVAGDMGPTGLRLAPPGALKPGAWEPWRRTAFRAFHALARALLDAGVDALHVETMTDLREARVALAAAQAARAEGGQSAPIWVSLTCRAAPGPGEGGPSGQLPARFETLAGQEAVAALASLRAEGADAVGVNCLLQAPAMVALARRAVGAGVGPLLLQPAAGQPRRVPAEDDAEPPRFVYDGDPGVFARALAAAALGERTEEDAAAPLACAVGGCCGTTPAWIEGLARRLSQGLAEGRAGP